MSKDVEICRYFVYGVSRKYLDQIDVNSKCRVLWDSPTHTQKKKFSVKDFFSKCEKINGKLHIYLY